MITSQQCLKKFGDPNLITTQASCMELWAVPSDIQTAFSHVRFSAVGTIGFPKKIFVNKLFKPVLERSLLNVIERGLADEMITWDGCFIIRQKRGLSTLSLHSWGLAVDINCQHNPLGLTVEQIKAKKLIPLSEKFLQCFRDAGCECGGDWSGRPDRQHFQLAKI